MKAGFRSLRGMNKGLTAGDREEEEKRSEMSSVEGAAVRESCEWGEKEKRKKMQVM